MAAKNATKLTHFGIVPDWSLPSGINACVTTVAEPGNLAVHVGDDPARVIRHRRRLQRELALPAQPKWLAQYHSERVVRFETCQMGAAADAIWATRVPSVSAVLTADCLPLLLASDNGEVIAAIHAGWRGLVAGIVENTMAALPCPPVQLRAFIGPAISRDYFQVGADVYEAFAQRGLADVATFQPQVEQKWLADLPLLAERVLAACGVTNITQSGLCTYSDPRFFSHRQSSTAGRIATLIWKS